MIWNYWNRKTLLSNSALANWLLLAHTFQKKWRDFTVAISWKTSATIANVISQPLVGTVGVVEVAIAGVVEVAIAAVPEVGDAGEDAIKEVVDKDTKVSSRQSTS